MVDVMAIRNKRQYIAHRFLDALLNSFGADIRTLKSVYWATFKRVTLNGVKSYHGKI